MLCRRFTPVTAAVFLLVNTVLPVASSARLNVPRVLLPFSQYHPEFRLSADSGCYAWSTTRPDVIKIVQQQNVVDGKGDSTCSSAVTISAVGPLSGKISAGVLAEDGTTGLTLRADVVVDKINSLRIVTKTHELYREETPEKFEVRAYDEQGNEFSTVEGMVFKWNIEPTRTGVEILRFMPWAESPYNTEPFLEKIESEGKQGNKVLLEGVKTGSAKVTVRLVDTSNNVPPTSESLMVVANLFLVPPVAYILPGAKVKYTANQFRGNRMQAVTLPSPHHQLGVDSTGLASLDQETATLTGQQLGHGQVELVDQNVDAGDVVKTPKAEVHVVLPARIMMTCLPYLGWSVLVQQQYQIKVEVFDKDSNKVFPSDNLVIDLATDTSYLRVTQSLKNGTLHDFVPLVAGTTEVTATLRGVMVDGSLVPVQEQIIAVATLEIFDRMTLQPQELVLPWNPSNTASGVTAKFEVQGGASPYSWQSSNKTLGVVSQMGVATVYTWDVGSTVISAAMTRATHNKAQGVIKVEPAEKLVFLDSEREFLIGTDLVLPLDIYSRSGATVARCEMLPYDTVLVDRANFQAKYADSAANSGCANLVVSSAKVAHTRLSTSFSFNEEGRIIKMSDATVIAAYSPLKPVFPASAETLVAQGSSVQIVWTGGPQPWPENPANHFAKTEVDKADLLKVESVRESVGVYAYRVECLALGETQIKLSVGNRASKSLPQPVVLTSTVKVICGTPAAITVTPRIHGPPATANLPPCPAALSSGHVRLATQSYLDLELDVAVKDAEGRVFDGVDSVEVSWSLSDATLGRLEANSGVLYKKNKQEGDILAQPNKPYQLLLVNKKTGKLDIKASLPKTGFLSSSPESLVKLDLVEDARIEPRQIELFHHRSVASGGKAVQGSGYFILESKPQGVGKIESEIVKASYHSNNQSINIVPMEPGTTELVLKDLCLSALAPGSSSVTVKGVVQVVLDILDRVQQGNSLNGAVKLYSANNKLLDASVLDYITVTVTSDSDIVSVGQAKSLSPTVKGENLGTTHLTATASYLGIQKSSAPAPVQVFPPLEIQPRNITLIIGASFQVLTTGGPAESTKQYFLGDQAIGDVNSDGLITGNSLGSTTLTARAVGRSKTGELVEYSRDTVQVHVVPLSSLRLFTPTKKIVVGGTLPVYILGQDDNINAYSFASAMPFLDITWSVQGSTNGGSLKSSWNDAGLSLTSSNTGVAIFKGEQPGKATISVKARVTERLSQFQIVEHRLLTASIQITVVEDLYPRIPETCCSNHVLVAPGSTLQLRTNRDGKAQFSKETTTSTGLTVSSGGLLKVTPNTPAPSTANILATVEEEVGLKLYTTWLVEVRPVHYIVLQGSSTSWQVKAGAAALPRGGILNSEVSCFDALGRKFQACPLDLKSRPSRFDLTKLMPTAGNSYNIRAVGNGYTVLRMEDKTTGLSAWGVLQVGEAMTAPVSMSVGDVIQLNAHLQNTQEGVWSVEPAGHVALTNNGLAVAKRIGQAKIQFTTKQGDSFVREVNIGKAITVTFPSDTVVTCKEEPTLIPFQFQGGVYSGVIDTNSPSLNFGAKCSLSSDTIDVAAFNVDAVLTPSGWACKLSCNGPADDMPGSLSLSVMTSEGVLDTKASIEYVPPFSVSSPVFEVGSRGGQLIVTGHVDVLTGLTTEKHGVHLESWWLEDSQLILPVYIISPVTSQPWVKIVNPSTGDSIKVTIQPVIDSSYRDNSGFLGLDSKSMITVIVCVSAAVYVLKGAKPAPAPGPAAPSSAPAASPSRSSTGGAAENGGAGSPAPYLWSVDNSPIYGSPLVKRSPTNARNLTYSYS